MSIYNKDYIQENINPTFELTRQEALNYAVGMGVSDSTRGIAQAFSKGLSALGSDNFEEYLKTKNKKLKKIFEHPEYGQAAFATFLASAIGADPITYVPIVGWISKGKKAKSLYDLTKYGAGAGAIVSGTSYVDEDASTLLQGKDSTYLAKKLEQIGLGGAFGATLVGGGAKTIDLISKARGKGGIFSNNIKDTPSKNPTKEEVKENIVKENSKNSQESFKLKDTITNFYQTKVGPKLLNAVMNNPAESLIGTAAGVYGVNISEDPNTTTMERLGSGAAYFLAGAAATRGIKVGGNYLGGKLTDRDDAFSNFLGRQLISDYGLTDQYKSLRAEFKLNKNQIGLKFLDLAERAQKELSVEQNQILYKFMIGELADVDVNISKITDEVRPLITKYAQELVDLGFLDEKTFKKNVDIYLKRTFSRPKKNKKGARSYFENSKQIRIIGDELRPRGITENTTLGQYKDIKSNFQKEGWEILVPRNKTLAQVLKLKDNTKIKVRRDYTPEERLELEEIENASFAIAETGRLLANDVSAAKFFDELSTDKDLSLSVKQWEQLAPIDQKEWVRVAGSNIKGTNKKRFGTLSGKYVKKEVYNDLKTIFNMSSDTTNPLKLMHKEYWLPTLGVWKRTKTTWNPATHLGNFASNVVLYDLAGAEYKYLIKAAKEMSNPNSKLARQALEDGIYDSGMLNKDIMKYTSEIEKSLSKFNPSTPSKGMFEYTQNTLKWIKNKTLDKADELYQFEDNIFRFGMYIDRLEGKGFNRTQAAQEARKQFIEYDINAPTINALRQTALPFLSYSYRVIPLLAENAILRPHKFLKWSAIGFGLNEIGRIASGQTPSEEDVQRVSAQQREKKRFLIDVPFMPPSFVRLPFNNKNGDALYWDTTRLQPGGDLFSQRENKLIPFIPDFLEPGGPIVDFPAKVLFQTDPFTGKKFDTKWEGAKSFIATLPPNIPGLPFSYATNRVLKNLRKDEADFDPQAPQGSYFSRPQTPFQSIAYGLGLKIVPVDTNTNRELVLTKFDRKARDIQNEKSKADRAYNNLEITEKRYLEILDNLDEEIVKLGAQQEIYMEYLNKIESKAIGERLEKERDKNFEGGAIDLDNPVLQVKDIPAERVNPYTGEPYYGLLLEDLPFFNTDTRLKAAEGFNPEEQDEYLLELAQKQGLKQTAPVIELLVAGVPRMIYGLGKSGYAFINKAMKEATKVPKPKNYYYHGSDAEGLTELIPAAQRATTKTGKELFQAGTYFGKNTPVGYRNSNLYAGEKGFVYAVDKAKFDKLLKENKIFDPRNIPEKDLQYLNSLRTKLQIQLKNTKNFKQKSRLSKRLRDVDNITQPYSTGYISRVNSNQEKLLRKLNYEGINVSDDVIVALNPMKVDRVLTPRLLNRLKTRFKREQERREGF